MLNCLKCGKHIPIERRIAIPNTELCVSCVDATIVEFKGFMSFEHKTAPTFIRIPVNQTESLRQAERANRRAR